MQRRRALKNYPMISTFSFRNTKSFIPWYVILILSHFQEFPKPSPGLLKLLAESGETPGYTPPAPAAPQPPPAAPVEDTKKRKFEATDDNRQSKKTSVASKGKEWTGKPNEMDRLAQGLQKLQEEDLLQVVRIVSEHKTQEMYVKNDLEGIFTLPMVDVNLTEGEFVMDLYTLGDPLLRTLWNFTKQRVEV